MRERKYGITLIAGIIIGATLTTPVTQAVTEHLEVQRSTQPIYVDGKQVNLEAYNINGANYVKLRDVGQTVDFEVYWDGAAVRIVSGQPYTGLPPVQPPTLEIPDHSQEANPAIFEGELSRENYNAIRDTIINHDAIINGRQDAIAIDKNVWSETLENALVSISRYPVYELQYKDGKYVCCARYTEGYAEAAEHTQSFIDLLAGKSQLEQVQEITWYVADRLTYSTTYAGPSKVLAQDGVASGNCVSYAFSFQFLCGRAKIPCILVASETHEWNMVYVDGQWWDVDVTANDSGDDTLYREYSTILRDPAERYGDLYLDLVPDVTRFAQELLVPGSTK